MTLADGCLSGSVRQGRSIDFYTAADDGTQYGQNGRKTLGPRKNVGGATQDLKSVLDAKAGSAEKLMFHSWRLADPVNVKVLPYSPSPSCVETYA